jgi:hypothetical protein
MSPYFDLKSCIPASSSEIDDMIASMILGAPRFIDRTLVFPIAISTARSTR